MRKYLRHRSSGHKHSGSSLIRDLILGGQDGLVNVLGIVLAVAVATNVKYIILISGLAATFAESISMAAVGFTSSKASKQYLEKQKQFFKNELKTDSNKIKKIVRSIYYKKGFRGAFLNKLVNHTLSKRTILKSIILEQQSDSIKEEYAHPFRDAIIIGLAAIIGSLVPLVPFFFFQVKTGILISILFSASILFIFGSIKTRYTLGNWLYSGLELMLIGIIAALIGFLIGVILGTIPI